MRSILETYDRENAAKSNDKLQFHITVDTRESSNQFSVCKFWERILWISSFASRLRAAFLHHECASTRLDVELCLQTNGFGTLHPEAAAPHAAVLLEHRAAPRGLQGRWKGELPGLDKVMGAQSPSSIHYLHKKKSYEKGCYRKDEIKQVNVQSSWL